MTKLEILKQLERRLRRKVEINKSMVDSICYHADMHASVDREVMRADKHRIQGLLQKPNVSHPMLPRHKCEELTNALGYGKYRKRSFEEDNQRLPEGTSV